MAVLISIDIVFHSLPLMILSRHDSVFLPCRVRFLSHAPKLLPQFSDACPPPRHTKSTSHSSRSDFARAAGAYPDVVERCVWNRPASLEYPPACAFLR